jgi:hypothetical protein
MASAIDERHLADVSIKTVFVFFTVEECANGNQFGKQV